MPLNQPTIKARVTQASDSVITNKSLPTANTEYEHTLTDSVKQVIIRCRGMANLRIAFISGDTDTTYFTVPRGTSFLLDGIYFVGTKLYLQASQDAMIVEILELY